jgi:hypothetical protein
MVALVAKKALERISVMVQVPLLESTDMLDELRRARRPLLPGHGHLQRLEQADDFRREAETICIEVLQAVKTVPGVSGANILHRGDAAAVMRVANAISD